MFINQQEASHFGDDAAELIQLSPGQKRLYEDAVYNTDVGVVLVIGGTKSCSRESLRRMRIHTPEIISNRDLWVDDDIVNLFGDLIQQRSKSNSLLPKVICLNSHFWPMLNKQYASVENWEHKVCFDFNF